MMIIVMTVMVQDKYEYVCSDINEGLRMRKEGEEGGQPWFKYYPSGIPPIPSTRPPSRHASPGTGVGLVIHDGDRVIIYEVPYSPGRSGSTSSRPSSSLTTPSCPSCRPRKWRAACAILFVDLATFNTEEYLRNGML